MLAALPPTPSMLPRRVTATKAKMIMTAGGEERIDGKPDGKRTTANEKRRRLKEKLQEHTSGMVRKRLKT